ncbi:MAG TPA: class I SAM-dependent methyltransferase [Ilumatobacteraceae bacterium]|nr:class I SAM-dependent methyltransferase [Ilumatobacteraceae bacterium]
MNQQHLDYLGTEEWRQTLRDHALPFAFGPLGPDALGADVLEIGPGPGMTTDLLRPLVPALTSIELDTALADDLQRRLVGTNVDVVEGDATAMPFEDGRFTGAVTFTMLHHVPTVELQDAMFREVHRVLRPGGLLVANDSVGREELAAFHVDDTYNPVDPTTLDDRLGAMGYVDIEIAVNPYAWACRARRPA